MTPCQQCACWVRVSDYYGSCRKRAPAIIGSDSPESAFEIHDRTHWPITGNDEWCMEAVTKGNVVKEAVA